MQLARLLLPIIIIAIAGCANRHPVRELALQELAQRQVALDRAGLQKLTRRHDDDGAYLFADAGYFDDIGTEDFREALKHAAASDNHGLYVMLATRGPQVSFPSAELGTALDQAIGHGNTGMVELLIRHGARTGPDSLMAAAYKDDHALTTLLIDHGADFDVGENQDAVYMAARIGKTDALHAFVQHARTPRTHVSRSILGAALTEKDDIVRYLVEHGVDVNQPDRDGCTPLHYLAQDGSVEIVHYLIDHGAAINATCRGRETPLKWAHYGSNQPIIDELKARGGVRY